MERAQGRMAALEAEKRMLQHKLAQHLQEQVRTGWLVPGASPAGWAAVSLLSGVDWH